MKKIQGYDIVPYMKVILDRLAISPTNFEGLFSWLPITMRRQSLLEATAILRNTGVIHRTVVSKGSSGILAGYGDFELSPNILQAIEAGVIVTVTDILYPTVEQIVLLKMYGVELPS